MIGTAAALAGCTTPDVKPIPGSIIYGGQPGTRLTKSPIGSTFPHRFTDDHGEDWVETYRIAPDRSLELVSRYRTDFDINQNR